MVIPQGVAYAALAGMPLVTGIYAAMLPALIAVLFSASHRLSVGPTALGFMRLGWLLNLVSAPVLMALTQGAALASHVLLRADHAWSRRPA